MKLFKPGYSIRISEKNFGFDGGIKAIPLYATFCLKQDSQYMADAGEMGPVTVSADEGAEFLQMQRDCFDVLNSVANYPELIPCLSATTASAYKSATMSFLSGAISAEDCAAEIQATVE